jgi:multiple sugar transport system permease protein
LSTSGEAIAPAGAGARLERPAYGSPLHERRDVLLLVVPCLLYLVAFSLFPLVYSLVISFFRWNQIASSFEFYGLQNFVDLAKDPVFAQAAANTALMTGVGVALQVVVGTALALFFDQPLRGAWLVRGILVLPMLLTPVVVGLMWRALLNPDWGMVNWVLGELGLSEPHWLGDPSVAIWTLTLVDSWQWTPFVLIVVFARLKALPSEVFEAAEVDGASRWQMLTSVTLPLLAPAIVFAAIFRAIDAFRSFDVVFGLTYGGPGRFTTTLSFDAFENGFTFQRYGYASALAYVMVIVATVVLTILFRFVTVRRADAT